MNSRLCRRGRTDCRGATEQGAPVRKRIFDDEGHGITKLENRIEASREIVEFLDEHVGSGA